VIAGRRLETGVTGNKDGPPACPRIGFVMSDLAYFEYALVLPEERYLIEVQTHNSAAGKAHEQDELQRVAKEALIAVVGQKGNDLEKKLNPNPISEAEAQGLAKVQQLLARPDCVVYLVE
jgi:hypothetical protein